MLFAPSASSAQAARARRYTFIASSKARRSPVRSEIANRTAARNFSAKNRPRPHWIPISAAHLRNSALRESRIFDFASRKNFSLRDATSLSWFATQSGEYLAERRSSTNSSAKSSMREKNSGSSGLTVPKRFGLNVSPYGWGFFASTIGMFV